MKILAVDTKKDNLEILVRCLKTAYPESEIIPFDDAMLSVRYGFNHSVDVVYTGIMMRHITGFQVMELLRKVHPELEVNFVTNTNEYVGLAAMNRANGYYITPITTKRLLKNNLL